VGGVPLFVAEFTKMVREAAPADAPVPTPLGHEIPSTLQDLVVARLDRMEGGRELAQLAAVLGREFSHEVLAAVAAVDEPSLQAELAELSRAEILYPKGRPPRCTYIFKHAAPEVGPVLLRASELCRRIEDPRQLFGIMLGTWEWRLVRGDLLPCVDLAADGVALAGRLDDPGMQMEALFMAGVTMFYRGQFA